MSSANFSHSETILPVQDLETSIRFYKEVLGFQDEKYLACTPAEATITRDCLEMHFRHLPELARQLQSSPEKIELILYVTNLDEIYREALARGARITVPLINEANRQRNFKIEDCNGYLLQFTEGISPA